MAQQTLSETVDLWAFVEGAIGFMSDVAHGETRLILTIEGKPVAGIVSMADLQRLDDASVEANWEGGAT